MSNVYTTPEAIKINFNYQEMLEASSSDIVHGDRGIGYGGGGGCDHIPGHGNPHKPHP